MPERFVIPLLALPAGFVMAYLSGATAGVATLLIIPVVVILSQHRRPVALFLCVFGLGFVAGAFFSVGRGSGLFSGAFSVGTAAYAASQIAIGVTFVLVGLMLAHHKRRHRAG